MSTVIYEEGTEDDEEEAYDEARMVDCGLSLGHLQFVSIA